MQNDDKKKYIYEHFGKEYIIYAIVCLTKRINEQHYQSLYNYLDKGKNITHYVIIVIISFYLLVLISWI